jgi:subtilisin
MTDRAKGLTVTFGIAVAVVAGCGGGGPESGSLSDTGLASIATTAGGQARVIIGFKKAPGNSEQALVRRAGGKVKRSYHLIPAMAATVPAAAIDGLRNNPNVTYIEGDAEVHALEDRLDWAPDRIDAEVVWGKFENAVDVRRPALTGAGVKVGIIDSGIDYNHPDLDDNYAGGYDFINDDADPIDDRGHGTLCAGVVAAEDNGEGAVNVAPEAEIYAAKVLNDKGVGGTSDLIAGIEWCVDNGMQVISMSLGYAGSKSVHDACDAAYAANVLLVAAAGNGGNKNGTGDHVCAPAMYDSVIAVAAVHPLDLRAAFSSTGPAVELAAPGVYVYTTVRGGGYGWFGGTSAATPHVAGVAALAIEGGVTSASEVRAAMRSTAEDMGDPGRDWWYGFGMVDAVAATGSSPPPPGSETGDLSGLVTDAQNGQGMVGATILVVETGQSFVSREQGGYGILDISPGVYTVTCSSTGYQTASETVEIVADRTTWLELALVRQ